MLTNGLGCQETSRPAQSSAAASAGAVRNPTSCFPRDGKKAHAAAKTEAVLVSTMPRCMPASGSSTKAASIAPAMLPSVSAP